MPYDIAKKEQKSHYRGLVVVFTENPNPRLCPLPHIYISDIFARKEQSADWQRMIRRRAHTRFRKWGHVVVNTFVRTLVIPDQ
jgi:hypothetical protein